MTDLVGSECSENHRGRAVAWGNREAAGSRDFLKRRGHSEGQAPLSEWSEEAGCSHLAPNWEAKALLAYALSHSGSFQTPPKTSKLQEDSSETSLWLRKRPCWTWLPTGFYSTYCK